MRILSLSAVVCSLVFAGCTKMTDYYVDQEEFPELSKEQIDQNVKNVFGTTFSPDQDWTMSVTGSVKIKADADFNDIVKVQVLSETPFLNGDAMVLNQANATNGETVELSFEAPKGATQLIAACVNKTGNYFVKTFDINAETVSFKSTGSRAFTRADVGSVPDLSTIKIELSNSMPSYNARRTIEAAKEGANANISAWKNSGWENERLWRPTKASDIKGNTTVTTSNGWIIDGQVTREIPNIDDSEKEGLEAALGAMKGFDDQSKKYNNMQVIRELHVNSKYNNYLTANGEPLIIAPVGLLSTDASYVYYYYYNPNAVSGMSDAQKTAYIKSLPKFRAFDCSYTKNALAQTEPKRVTIENNRYIGFFKMHEYLLPYYGDDPLPTTDATIATAAVPHSTYSGIYRIRSNKKGPNGDYYLTYLGNPSNKDQEKLDYLYSENVDNQLWQIFKMPDSDNIFLYNIGAQKWLISENNKGEYSIFSSEIKNINNGLLQIENNGDIIHFKSSSNWGYLGANQDSKKNNKVAFNKKLNNLNDGYTDWYIEEYAGTRPEGAIDNIELETKTIAFEMNPVSLTIPAGYKVGFMNRKGNDKDSNNFTEVNKGETYGDGNLNKEINTYPNFSNAVNLFGMRSNDPRTAIFQANGHNYITFEEGVDCNFTDIIIEIVNGVNIEAGDLSVEPQNAVYTFCFEDRQDGDYDLNDVIIKAMRLDKTHVLFSLEACGAYDELYLRNIHGKVLNSTTEVHKMFSVDNTETFINTQGGERKPPIQDVVQVKDNYSFNNTGTEQIYIYNKTTDKEIHLSTTGEDPHGMMIPSDFKHPTETTSINKANEYFLKWTEGDNDSYDWYNKSIVDKVCQNATFEISEKIINAYPQYFNNGK